MKTEEHQGDPLVINTIQLLAHKRALDRLLDMVETYKTAISSGELERMPPLAPPPHMPDVVPGLDNMRDPGILDPRHFFFPRHFYTIYAIFTRFTRFLHDFM